MSLKYDVETIQLPVSWKKLAPMLLAAGIVCLAISGAVALTASGAPDGMRLFTHSYLANFVFLFSFSIGALFFILIQFLTRAGWSSSIRRVAEIVMVMLPISAILFLPVLFLVWQGSTSLYEWNLPAEQVGNSVIKAKVEAGYLDKGFFTFRSIVYVALLSGMATWMFSKSRAQDESGDVELSVARQKWAGPMVAVFALTVSFVAFDWVMSLDADWYSTIFGVYYFAASMMGFFAMMVILNMKLQKAGKLSNLVNVEHYHDMGKFMFGFVMFWSYIAFSQLLLYWYGGIPEETEWYRVRLSDGWEYLSYGLIFVHFIIPFLGLMSRHVRRNRSGLFFWACWLIFVHWLDMSYLVIPNVGIGLAPVAMLGHFIGGVGMLLLFGAFFIFRANNVPLVAMRDPRLPEALTYTNPLL